MGTGEISPATVPGPGAVRRGLAAPGTPAVTLIPADAGTRHRRLLNLHLSSASSIPHLTALFQEPRARTPLGAHCVQNAEASGARYSPNKRRLHSSRISSAMLVLESRTSSANGAFGRHERQDSVGMRLVTAASRCRSSVRRSTALIVRQAGQRTQRNQFCSTCSANNR